MFGRRYRLPLLMACVLAWALATSSLGSAVTPSGEVSRPSKANGPASDSDGDGHPDRPDAGSASVVARTLGERVEDVSQRTATKQVFINPDGTWTREISSGPVRAQDPASGKWAPISTTLVETADGWRPANALGEVSFSDGGLEPLARMHDVSGKELSWSWPSVLPVPTVKGSTLTYADVVPNGDLVVEALPDGFSHSIVLRAAPSKPLRLPMLVEANGARVTERKDGSLAIKHDEGKALVTAPTPLMWDAAVARDLEAARNGETGRAGAGAGAEGSRPKRVDVAVAATDEGGRVVLKPDAAFLADPDTEYPVTIDPTYSQYPRWTVTVNDQTDYPPTGFGAVGRGWYIASSVSRALLSWGAVTSFGETITSATLSTRGLTACAPHPVTVQRLTSAWSSQDVTWATQPTAAPEGAAGAVGVGQSDQCLNANAVETTWDVTGIAQAWAAGAPNYGLRLRAADESAAPSRLYLPATLSITGSGAPLEAAVPRVSDGYYQNGSHTTNAKPEWTTSARDPDGTTVRYTVKIHESDSASSPVVASCTTTYVPSGTEAACSSNVWLSNGTYYARARADDGTLNGAWSPWLKTTVNHPPSVAGAAQAPTMAFDTNYGEHMSCGDINVDFELDVGEALFGGPSIKLGDAVDSQWVGCTSWGYSFEIEHMGRWQIASDGGSIVDGDGYVNISNIEASVTSTVGCSFDFVGSLAAELDVLTGTVTPSHAALYATNVVGCSSYLLDGDSIALISGTFTLL